MATYSLRSRSLLSTWLSLVLMVLLVSYLAFIEFFQDTKREKATIDLLKSPIRSDILKNLNSLKFKNRIGSFTIKKENKDWLLIEPRVMPAKLETVNQIIKTLQSIKIQTVHQHEPINLQSFSLDKPVIEMELLTKLDDKLIIKVGLINPINNTSYITVSGHNRIYQTSFINSRLQSYELSNFIDSNVFSMKNKDLKHIHIYHGSKAEPFNSISHNGSLWQTKKFNVINNDKMEKKVETLLNTKTHMIIDKKDESLQNFINNYLKNPYYRIVITLNSGEKINYRISHPIKAISDLKIEKKQFFLMTASDRPYPYVINKSFYNNFKIRYKDIRN